MCASCKINDSIIVEPPLGNKRYSQNKYIISLRWSFLWEMNAFADGDRWFPDGRPCPRILLNFYKNPLISWAAARISKYGILEPRSHRFPYTFVKENHCLERHGQNIEIWPCGPGAKKTLIFIYFIREDHCLESLGQNIGIWPPRAKKPLILIYFKRKSLSWEPWAEY